MLFSVWRLSIIIDGHTSSDWLLGLMLVKVHCVSCLGLIWVSWVGWHSIGLLCCVCVAHDVCVVLRSSSVFLVFYYVIMGEKVIIVILSQQVCGGCGHILSPDAEVAMEKLHVVM